MKIKSKPVNSIEWLRKNKPVKQVYSGPLELLAAQDAICKIPISMTPLKEDLAAADNIQERAVIGCLESVERLGLVGISGLHAVRYLKSVLLSRRDGTLPPYPCSYTGPMLEALESESDGVTSSNNTARNSRSTAEHPAAKRKKAVR